MIPGYAAELFRGKRMLLVRYFVTSIGRALSQVLLVLMIQQFLSVSRHSDGTVPKFVAAHFGASWVFTVMAVALIVVNLIGSVLGYDNRIVQQRAAETLELGVMEKIIRHILGLSLNFFNKQSKGDLVQTIRTDVINLRQTANAYATIIRGALLALSLAATVLWLSPLLSFYALILLPFIAIPLLAWSSKRLRLSSRKLRSTGFALFDIVLQIISGIRIIKAYGAEETEARLSVVKGNYFFKCVMEVAKVRAQVQVILEAVGGMSLVVVIAVGGYQVSQHKMVWEVMVAFVFATRSLFGPLYEIYGALSDIHSYQASHERIQELLETKPDLFDRPDARPLLESPSVIRFENVSFGYDGPGSPTVLSNLNFEVCAGETIGIVGPSGAGKSTLLNLIVRFYDATAGRVLFDGVDIREYRVADVYRQTAIVAQEPFLFATTVRENIRCARPEATDLEVEAAGIAASIHDEIVQLPEGYETPVGTGGRELSRGQAQRVNVARALLRNSKLLLLDEATASLDSIAEAQVQRSIDTLMAGRTCFIVAHRLSTLRNADRLIVIDRGKCIAFGSHDELMTDCALYRQFWALQQLGQSDIHYLSSMLPEAAPNQHGESEGSADSELESIPAAING